MQTEYIKARELRIGDRIQMRHETYTQILGVVDVHTFTQTAQGRSEAVVVVARGSYSPSWHVFDADRTMAIVPRS